MLARAFDGSEAAAIWVELVRERENEIVEIFEQGKEVHSATLTASRIELTREQLTEWDASARA